MPSAAEIERFEALIKRLTPLSNVQRGQMIRAEDWNVLVGALIEVSRSSLVDEDAGVVPPHEHPEQVSSGWLEPRLRTLVERGPLSDPAADARLTRLTQQLERLSKRVEELHEALGELRAKSSDFVTRDVARESQFRTLSQRVEAFTDPRDEVLSLRQSLSSLQDNVRQAIEVGNKVAVDGKAVDLRKLAERVQSVEEFRDKMRQPASGQLLDAKTLDLRLAEISNKFVSHDRLAEAFKNRPVTVAPEHLTAVTNRLEATVAENVKSSLGRVREEIRAETGARLGGLDALVARSVSDAGASLRTDVLNTVQGQINNAVRKTADETTALIEKRVGDTDASLRRTLAQRLDTVQSGLTPLVRAAVEEHSTRLVSPLNENFRQVLKRVDAAEAKLSTQEEAARTTATRVEVTARTLAVANEETRAQLLTEMERRDVERRRELGERLAQADLVTKPVLERAVNDARRAATEEARRSAADAALTEVRVAETRLLGESRRIAREELQSTTDQIRGVVTNEVKTQLNTVPGLVSAEVRRATAQLPDLVRTEVNTLQLTARPPVAGTETTIKKRPLGGIVRPG